ncbi:terpene cyclase/mutase family protein [Streptomyces kaniharaensis]|uniref:Terpene cyclase/mutase family protein n=1 Tax=Streptomyces kaniharaensis TaxID=212423 RepID=A0A6N7KNJ3_9ACTN|nr:prenyltransferase/squalene oxidase repeat-containing protein [Streptomyces kaniharaensis]MQS12018.1 terpene cyclase/mutase family protein [Streptomyces kaniharaensis]
MLTVARLGAAALSAALLAGTAAAPALADSPAPTAAAAPDGLYGKSDPTYDGVWRQSLALTALAAAKVAPADSAVSWLTGQQCEDGGWPSFRASGAGCDAKTEDSNATAVAIQALAALGGHQDAVDKGVQWLKANQNADGSWPYNPGSPGDANSTGLAVNALFAAKADPAGVAKAGKNAFDGLAHFQLGCAVPADQRGAFAYQPDPSAGALAPNALATAQASLAAAGGWLPVAAGVRSDAAPKPLPCPDGAPAAPVARADSAEAVGAYLTAQLAAGGNHLTLTTPGAAPTPDYTATAWAALGLTQSGHPQQAAGALDWLGQNGATWTKGGTDAGATATLLLVTQAAQRDTSALVGQLTALGPAPKAAVSPSAGPTSEKAEDDGIGQYWLIAVGLLIGIGGGLVLSLQRKRGAKL